MTDPPGSQLVQLLTVFDVTAFDLFEDLRPCSCMTSLVLLHVLLLEADNLTETPHRIRSRDGSVRI